MNNCENCIEGRPRIGRLAGVARTMRLALFEGEGVPTGTPQDLTGLTVVVRVLRDGTNDIYTPDFTVEGASNNTIKFAWPANRQAVGNYTFEVTMTDASQNVTRVDWHGPTGLRLVEHSYQVYGDDAIGVQSNEEIGLIGYFTTNGVGASAFDEWLGSSASAGYPQTVDGFMEYLQKPATDAAAEAEATMTAIQERADGDHTRAGNDHSRAEDDHTQAGNDHTRAESDHTRAGDDHTQAGSDHTRAGNDHTLAAADHGTAAADHTLAGKDHDKAVEDHNTAASDHTQAGQDHTRANTDHGVAADDHTQAGTDHTRAESDHGIAAGDHTQAGTDHTRAESDHTRAGEDHTQAGNDHTQAGSDHTRAESDHTRAESDHASIADKVSQEELAAAVEPLARKDGYYDSLGAGTAKKLEGQNAINSEFTFRKTPDGVDSGLSFMRSIRGKTVVWNQQVQNGTATIPSGHKYLAQINGTASISTSDGTSISAPNSGDMVIDLTLMFGYGNEPSTVAEFEALYPLPYYAYDAGTLKSNAATAVEFVGRNQWDEEWEVGNINWTTGENASGSSSIRSKNYLPVFPGASYCLGKIIGTGANFRVAYYDANKEYIAASSWNNRNNIIVLPNSCFYIKFVSSFDGATYKHDICINLSDPSFNGQYEPYHKETLTLNIPTITGKLNGEGESVTIFPDGLRGAGTAFDELVVDSDGYARKAVKRVNGIDLGDVSGGWAGSQSTRYTATISDLKIATSNTAIVGMVSSKYQYVVSSQVANYDKVISSNNGVPYGQIMLRDTSIALVADVPSAVAGVMLYYELDTPLTYILDTPIYVGFQASAGGTEKRLPVDTASSVLAPFVAEMVYPIDAVGWIDKAPQNYISKESLTAMLEALKTAGIIAAYTMTFDATSGKYVFTFTAPS